MNELDSVDVNELVAALLRRKQHSFDSMFALLDLMIDMSSYLATPNKFQIAELLRDAADACERSPERIMVN